LQLKQSAKDASENVNIYCFDGSCRCIREEAK
jgi:hypothetical protein